MKILWTKSSRDALAKVQRQMIKQSAEGNVSKFVLKFTKKKEFLAIPSPWFKIPAFQLYVNGSEELFAVYVFRKNRWVII